MATLGIPITKTIGSSVADTANPEGAEVERGPAKGGSLFDDFTDEANTANGGGDSQVGR